MWPKVTCPMCTLRSMVTQETSARNFRTEARCDTFTSIDRCSCTTFSRLDKKLKERECRAHAKTIFFIATSVFWSLRY